MNGARERRLFMATSMVELRVGVAAADAAHKPLSRQQRYARTLKIAGCAGAPAARRALSEKEPEGASGNLFCAQLPERRDGRQAADCALVRPTPRPCVPDGGPSMPPTGGRSRCSADSSRPTARSALGKDLLAQHHGKCEALRARVAVVPLSGDGLRLFSDCAGGLPRPAGGRVAIFPTSAFMEMKACVPAEYARGRRPRRGAAVLRCGGAGRRTRRRCAVPRLRLTVFPVCPHLPVCPQPGTRMTSRQ